MRHTKFIGPRMALTLQALLLVGLALIAALSAADRPTRAFAAGAASGTGVATVGSAQASVAIKGG